MGRNQGSLTHRHTAYDKSIRSPIQFMIFTVGNPPEGQQ
jgi:hypothetical protein